MGAARDFLPQFTARADEEFDPLVEATLAFEEAARRLDLEDWIVHRLRQPERELTIHLPRVADNGQVTTFTAFRVRHSTVRGPALGGVRLRPDLHLGQVKADAMAMTWQCALLDLPFGGCAGAIVCDPRKLSERELRRLVKDYIWALRDVLGPFQDVITPDAGCNDRTMAWMSAGYSRLRGEMGAVLGKPAVLGGLPAYWDATARGLLLVLQEVLAERNAPLCGQRVAIQGFGNVGGAAALFLFEAGARIVAVCDTSGGLYHEGGLDIPALRDFVSRTGTLSGYPGAQAVSSADVLQARCEVLIPAAAEKQLTTAIAGRVQAAIVLEAARGAITRGAEKILESRGVLVVPDILANAGAVIGSFLEWAQNLRFTCLSTEEVEESLKTRLHNAYGEVKNAARCYTLNLRQAAHLVGVQLVAAALRLA